MLQKIIQLFKRKYTTLEFEKELDLEDVTIYYTKYYQAVHCVMVYKNGNDSNIVDFSKYLKKIDDN